MTHPHFIRVNRAQFAAMWNDPMVTTEDLAAAFKMSRSTTTYIGKRLGLPERRGGPKPKHPREPFATWWLAGVLASDICAALGMCRNYPTVLAKRLGLPPRSRGFRGGITLADYRAVQLREAMAASARETEAALRKAEMVDTIRKVAA